MGKKGKSENRENKKRKGELNEKKNKSHPHQTIKNSLESGKSKKGIAKENRRCHIVQKPFESNSPKTYISKKEIIKKNVLIPLKKMNIKPKKDIKKMTIEEIKEFVSEFDLNPEANYIILDYLKKTSINDFNKYIEKYKYTLNFKDAFLLKSFTSDEVKQILEEFNKNF